MTPLNELNPYRVQAGPVLDEAIHRWVLRLAEAEVYPKYSEDTRQADRIRAWVRAEQGYPVVSGRTRLRDKPWFARLETDSSTSTEVLAETYPLAVCRLALLTAMRNSS